MAWKGFREFMCERGARSLRLSVWGSRSDSLTEGERQQTGAEHTHTQAGEMEGKGKGLDLKHRIFFFLKLRTKGSTH